MKRLLFLIPGAIFGLLACTSTEPAATPTTPPQEAVASVQVAVAGQDFGTGSPRIPVVLYDGPEQVSDARQVNLTAFDLAEEPPVAGWTGLASGYNDYEVPYWVAYPELSSPGLWGLAAEITLGDGSQARAQFTVEVHEDPSAPSEGETAPLSQNRTLATEPDIALLSSDWDDPNPALYQKTVAEAVAGDGPTVVVFATPAFCQTALCAPVLTSVKQVYEAQKDRVNFIHIEIYKQFNPELVLADEVEEWGLQSEPWTFVLDDDGRVSARLVGPLSPRELTAVLEPLLP